MGVRTMAELSLDEKLALASAITANGAGISTRRTTSPAITS